MNVKDVGGFRRKNPGAKCGKKNTKKCETECIEVCNPKP